MGRRRERRKPERNQQRVGENLVLHLKFNSGEFLSDSSIRPKKVCQVNDVVPTAQAFPVRVENTGDGSKFYLDYYGGRGVSLPVIDLYENHQYVFDFSDSSNNGFKFRLSTEQDGVHEGGSHYSTDWIEEGSPGQEGARAIFKVTDSTPSKLYYYDNNSSNVGGDKYAQVRKANDVTLATNSGDFRSSSGSAEFTGESCLFVSGSGYEYGQDLKLKENFTLQTWAKAKQTGYYGAQCLFDLGTLTGIIVSGTDFQLYGISQEDGLGNEVFFSAGFTDLNVTGWNHYCVSRKDNILRIYENGNLKHAIQHDEEILPTPSSPSGHYYTLGATKNFNLFYSGFIDDFGLYEKSVYPEHGFFPIEQKDGKYPPPSKQGLNLGYNKYLKAYSTGEIVTESKYPLEEYRLSNDTKEENQIHVFPTHGESFLLTFFREPDLSNPEESYVKFYRDTGNGPEYFIGTDNLDSFERFDDSQNVSIVTNLNDIINKWHYTGFLDTGNLDIKKNAYHLFFKKATEQNSGTFSVIDWGKKKAYSGPTKVLIHPPIPVIPVIANYDSYDIIPAVSGRPPITGTLGYRSPLFPQQRPMPISVGGLKVASALSDPLTWGSLAFRTGVLTSGDSKFFESQETHNVIQSWEIENQEKINDVEWTVATHDNVPVLSAHTRIPASWAGQSRCFSRIGFGPGGAGWTDLNGRTSDALSPVPGLDLDDPKAHAGLTGCFGPNVLEFLKSSSGIVDTCIPMDERAGRGCPCDYLISAPTYVHYLFGELPQFAVESIYHDAHQIYNSIDFIDVNQTKFISEAHGSPTKINGYPIVADQYGQCERVVAKTAFLLNPVFYSGDYTVESLIPATGGPWYSCERSAGSAGMNAVFGTSNPLPYKPKVITVTGEFDMFSGRTIYAAGHFSGDKAYLSIYKRPTGIPTGLADAYGYDPSGFNPSFHHLVGRYPNSDTEHTKDDFDFGTGEFTIETWIKTDYSKQPGSGTIFSYGNRENSGNTSGYSVSLRDDGNFSLHVDDFNQSGTINIPDTNSTGEIILSSSEWYHIALKRFDTGIHPTNNLQLKVNDTGIWSGTFTGYIAGAENFQLNIGRKEHTGDNGSHNYYSGLMSHFRIFHSGISGILDEPFECTKNENSGKLNVLNIPMEGIFDIDYIKSVGGYSSNVHRTNRGWAEANWDMCAPVLSALSFNNQIGALGKFRWGKIEDPFEFNIKSGWSTVVEDTYTDPFLHSGEYSNGRREWVYRYHGLGGFTLRKESQLWDTENGVIFNDISFCKEMQLSYSGAHSVDDLEVHVYTDSGVLKSSWSETYSGNGDLIRFDVAAEISPLQSLVGISDDYQGWPIGFGAMPFTEPRTFPHGKNHFCPCDWTGAAEPSGYKYSGACHKICVVDTNSPRYDNSICFAYHQNPVGVCDYSPPPGGPGGGEPPPSTGSGSSPPPPSPPNNNPCGNELPAKIFDTKPHVNQEMIIGQQVNFEAAINSTNSGFWKVTDPKDEQSYYTANNGNLSLALPRTGTYAFEFTALDSCGRSDKSKIIEISVLQPIEPVKIILPKKSDDKNSLNYYHTGFITVEGLFEGEVGIYTNAENKFVKKISYQDYTDGKI